MIIRLAIIISISSVFISCGFFWYRRSSNSEDSYNFIEDFKHTFLTLRVKYGGSLNNGNSRKIAPVMTILIGLVILVVGLIKLLR